MYGNILNSSVNNIPTSYSSATGSLLVSTAPASGTLFVLNYTADVLAITVGSYHQTPTTALPGNETYIPAAPTGGSGVATFDIKVIKGDKIYLRTTGASATTSGKVYWSLI